MGVDPHTHTEESPDPACSQKFCPFLLLFMLPLHSMLKTRTKQTWSVSRMHSPIITPPPSTTQVLSTSGLSTPDHFSTLVTGLTAGRCTPSRRARSTCTTRRPRP